MNPYRNRDRNPMGPTVTHPLVSMLLLGLSLIPFLLIAALLAKFLAWLF